MESLSETVRMKRWQAILLLGFSGFAVGNILAKSTAAMGL